MSAMYYLVFDKGLKYEAACDLCQTSPQCLLDEWSRRYKKMYPAPFKKLQFFIDVYGKQGQKQLRS